MKAALLLALVVLAGCSSPTAPSPPVVVVPPVVVAPPVVVTPPAPVPNPLLSDPRFSLSFYRMFALGGGSQPLQRQAGPPNVYLYTIDDAGAIIDARSIDSTAAALINTAGQLTGTFGLASLHTGTGPAPQLPNMITVFWAHEPNPAACGEGSLGGKVIRLYPNTPGCRCDGLAMRPLTVKHELGHALGFYHTGDARDLMSGLSVAGCDLNPSAREIFHARVAYSMPLGSLDP